MSVVLDAANGKTIRYAGFGDQDSGSSATFFSNGEVTIKDKNGVLHEHQIDAHKGGFEAHVTAMRRAIEMLKKIKLAVPKRNIEIYGSEHGVAHGSKHGAEITVARQILNVKQMEGFIEVYEKLPPDVQAKYTEKIDEIHAEK